MSKRIRNIVLGVLAVIAMFIPTYIAIANYATLGSWKNTLTGDSTVITVKEGVDGSTVFHGEAGEKNTKDLSSALAEMLSEGKALRSNPTTDGADVYTITAKIKENERNYYCYYGTSDGESYLFDDHSNVYYDVENEIMLPFLQSFFYGQSHETLSVPTLIAAGNEIIPAYIDWNHKNNLGNFNPVLDLATVTEEATYPVNKNISLRFTLPPDIATVKVYNGSTELYNGDYEDFIGLSYNDSVNLTVTIKAKWEQAADRDYYGEASYQFYVNYSANPAFALSATTATVGDYIAINVLNAADPESITFKSSPDIGATPAFYTDGDYVRGLLPLHCDLEGGVYKITVSTKGAEETFDLTVEDRSTLSRTYDAGTDLIRRARSAESVAEYEKMLRDIGTTRSTTKYFNGKFIDYRKTNSIGAVILLGYGHSRTLSNGDSYRMDGVDFLIYQGTDIPALNSGMVIAAGQTDYLGNYVIVDHGLGLRTWYCHLSEVSVGVGDTVSAAQAVGKSGNTGFTTNAGVYLICTVGSTPISPYTLWDNGVVY